jgi:hypothetical protein
VAENSLAVEWGSGDASSNAELPPLPIPNPPPWEPDRVIPPKEPVNAHPQTTSVPLVSELLHQSKTIVDSVPDDFTNTDATSDQVYTPTDDVSKLDSINPSVSSKKSRSFAGLKGKFRRRRTKNG